MNIEKLDGVKRFGRRVVLAGSMVISFGTLAIGADSEPMPGRIPAMAFRQGVEGDAYHDRTPFNDLGFGRVSGVEIDAAGRLEMAEGEWVEYLVDVAETGVYAVNMGVQRQFFDRSKAAFHLEVDGVLKTGALRVWSMGAGISERLFLSRGTHRLRLVCDNDDRFPTVEFLELVPAPAGTLETVAGDADGYVDGPVTFARFSSRISAMDVDSAGNIYLADAGNRRVRRIGANGVVETVAGSGEAGSQDGPAAAASFSELVGLSIGAGGVCHVIDVQGGVHTLRRITGGSVETVYSVTNRQLHEIGPDGNGGLSVRYSDPLEVRPGVVAWVSRAARWDGSAMTLVGPADWIGRGHATGGMIVARSYQEPFGFYTTNQIQLLGPLTTQVLYEPPFWFGTETEYAWRGVALDFEGSVHVLREIDPDAEGGGFFEVAKVVSTNRSLPILRFQPGRTNVVLAFEPDGNIVFAEDSRIRRLVTGSEGVPVNAWTRGGGTVAGFGEPGFFASNSVVSATATAAPGFEFLGWTGDVVSNSLTLSITVRHPLDAEAQFGRALDLGGMIGGRVQLFPEQPKYRFGSPVRLSAVASNGFRFAGWIGGGLSYAQSTNSAVDWFVEGEPPVPQFQAVPHYTLSAIPFGGVGGTVGTAPSGAVHDSNSVVRLFARPSPGYVFQTWLDNVQINPREVVVRSNATLIAVFAPGSNLPPKIVRGPDDAPGLRGGSARLSVVASGGEPLEYQWFHGGAPIEGAIWPDLVVHNVAGTDFGTYTVVVTNSTGSASASAEIRTAEGLGRGAVLRVALPQVLFSFHGEPLTRYTVQGSTNLLDWTDVMDAGATAEPVPIVLPFRPDAPEQFFRAIRK